MRTPLEPIDISTASADELQLLPGIGPTLARRIVDGRPYAKVDDLLKVRGVSGAVVEAIKPHVVRGADGQDDPSTSLRTGSGQND